MDFFQSVMGHRFFEHDVPQLITTLQQLHQDILKLIDCKEHELKLRQRELHLER